MEKTFKKDTNNYTSVTKLLRILAKLLHPAVLSTLVKLK